MTSRFFRFLSKRGNKSSSSTTQHLPNSNISLKPSNTASNNSKHVKLNVCEDLKESIEHYNQRCQEIKKLKERQELDKLNNQFNSQNEPSPGFLSFKSFNSKNKHKSSSTINNNNFNPNSQHQQQTFNSPPKDSIECAIIFLDDTQENFFLPKNPLHQNYTNKCFTI